MHLRRAARLTGAAMLAVTCGADRALAQDEALVTDRPDFTESPSSVEPGRVQIEAGYTYERAAEDRGHDFGEVLLRVGSSERLELRLGLPSLIDGSSPSGRVRGFGDTAVGIKLETAAGAEGPGLADPAMALLLTATLPTGDARLGEPHLQPAVALAFAWSLSERVGLGSNLGLAWSSSGGEQFVEASLSLALGADLGGDWGAFLEGYGLFAGDSGIEDRYFFDTGITRLLSNDLQLDLRFGTEVGGAGDRFAGAGFTYRW